MIDSEDKLNLLIDRTAPGEVLVMTPPTLLDFGAVARLVLSPAADEGRFEAWDGKAWIMGVCGVGPGAFFSYDAKRASAEDMDEAGLPESERTSVGVIIPDNLA